MPRSRPADRSTRSTTTRRGAAAHDSAAQKNKPLVDDIRLLGRILGDVIREQEGDAAFELVERVRQLSVAYRLKDDASAGRTLDRLLKSLSIDQTISVIRAFSYFSHLANIAEDRHHVRRRRVHERLGQQQPGSLAHSLARLAKGGVDADTLAQALQQAYVSPVLTAHPTEVQRKSILDAERAVAELVAERDALSGEREHAANERVIRARVTQLWQTRMLRTTRLTVADEIDNALSYYPRTFLRQLPRLYAELEQALPGQPVPTFLRMGHWIGGDRDGNPNVDASTLQLALARQCETALRFYLTEVHELGAELSVSMTLASATPELIALAERSGDHGEHRLDEPYRRALIGVYARLAATLHALTGEPRIDADQRHRSAAPRGGAQRAIRIARCAAGRLAHRRRVAAQPPRAGAGRDAVGAVAARGAGVRLSPRHRRSAPELRPPCRGGGRAAARRRDR
jgi:phosphoenolpyruvate carboxylase